MLSLQDLHCQLLGPVHLDIAPGECVSLTGPSGSGKTLLLRAIADLDRHEGEMSVDGRSWREMSGPEWRRQVAYLPAESHWWAELVSDHIPASCEGLLSALGFGAETLTWTVSRLSTGERQRLALVRLLCQEPKALLLDEPTANLDPANTARVEELIRGIRTRSQTAVLWVSHDPDQRARVADRRLGIRGSGIEPEAVQ